MILVSTVKISVSDVFNVKDVVYTCMCFGIEATQVKCE